MSNKSQYPIITACVLHRVFVLSDFLGVSLCDRDLLSKHPLMVSVVHISVLLGRNLQTDLDALDRMVVDSLVGSGDNALSGGDDKEREGNDESMVEEIESQV